MWHEIMCHILHVPIGFPMAQGFCPQQKTKDIRGYEKKTNRCDWYAVYDLSGIDWMRTEKGKTGVFDGSEDFCF